ncbi:MAG TPA: class I SAM-dependent methyltransferase [Patescibacteria group bacterium]
MNVTDYLVEKSGGMLNPVKEVRDDGREYKMQDDGGVELEVGEFLYGLTKLLKPQRVLTTGIYTGISDMYIAQALKENGFGNSTALEFEVSHLNRARELWKRVDVNHIIDSRLTPSLDFKSEGLYQLMFLDTEPNLRFHELVRFFPHLDEGGYVFIHDAPRNLTQGNVNPDHPEIESWPFGNLPEEIKQWVREDKLRPIHFPNPRGLVGFYRPHKDDYQWK